MDRAVGLELINEPGKALALYHELSTRLSRALHGIAQRREGEGQGRSTARQREEGEGEREEGEGQREEHSTAKGGG